MFIGGDLYPMFKDVEQVYKHYEKLADEKQAKFDEIGIDNLLRIVRANVNQDDIERLENQLGVELHSSLKNLLLAFSFANFEAFGTFSWSIDVNSLEARNPQGGFEYGFKPTKMCDSCLIIADGDSIILIQDQEKGFVYAIDLAQNFHKSLVANNVEQLILIAASISEAGKNYKNDEKLITHQVQQILEEYIFSGDIQFWKSFAMGGI